MFEFEIQGVVAAFIQTAEVNGLKDLSVQDPNAKRDASHPGKGVWLKNGTDIPCRVVARDELGNWCVVTEDGMVRQYLANEVL